MVNWADKLRRVLCDVCKPLIDLNEVSVPEEEGRMSPGTEFQAGMLFSQEDCDLASRYQPCEPSQSQPPVHGSRTHGVSPHNLQACQAPR